MHNTHNIGPDLNVNPGALAAEAQVSVKASKLYSLLVYNSKGSAQHIQIHDSATVPAEGAVPKMNIPIATVAFQQLSFPDGIIFKQGIYVCNSSTAATKTIGSADCLIDANFRHN